MADTLQSIYLPELGEATRGKVRDIYTYSDRLALIASDRISVFDRLLDEAIPEKGKVLTQLSLFWFDQTKDIIQNHLLSSPDPNVILVKKCRPILLEVIVRSYLEGSLWRAYEKGQRKVGNISLPDGMKRYDKLPQPVVTPTTKNAEGHDEPISEEALLAQGIAGKELWKAMKTAAFALFERGTELLLKRNIILVDTKYEFGLNSQGQLTLIDEIHTPDSSRFWYQDANGNTVHTSPDKEFVRAYCINQGFSGDGKHPTLPAAIVAEVSSKYCSLYKTITGQALPKEDGCILQRLLRHLKAARLIKGTFILLITDGPSHTLANKLAECGLAYARHSIDEDPRDIAERYNQSLEPIVCICESKSQAYIDKLAKTLRWPLIIIAETLGNSINQNIIYTDASHRAIDKAKQLLLSMEQQT